MWLSNINNTAVISVEITEVKYTIDCYKDVGLRYNDSVDVAVNGTKCLPKSYPYLLNNFSRNHQAYGKRPFCCIDFNKRMWEYCDIQKCPKDGGIQKI